MLLTTRGLSFLGTCVHTSGALLLVYTLSQLPLHRDPHRHREEVCECMAKLLANSIKS